MKVEQWAPVAGLVLEPNALEAVRESGRNVLLSAGPGAGKTEVLAQRADFLLRTGTCRHPRRILAISFKVDAAKNLRQRVNARSGKQLGSRLESVTFHAFAKRIIDQFRPLLTGSDALGPDYSISDQRVEGSSITFADIIPLAIQIVNSSQVVQNALRQTYSHVFLDEFQDCTRDQYALISVIFRNTESIITAVGDKKQTIMYFAGALRGVFDQYLDDFHARDLPLYQNYRSLTRLRRMQNDIVKVIDPPAALADSEVVGDEGIVEAFSFDDPQAEASWIANEVDAAISIIGLEPHDIAVLVAKQSNLYAIELKKELTHRQIPFRDEAELQDLAAEPVVRLIIDFLTVVLGKREPAAFHALMDALIQDQEHKDSFMDRREWLVFIEASRVRLAESAPSARYDDLRDVVFELLDRAGLEFLRSLSPSYENGPYVTQKVKETLDQLSKMIDGGMDAESAIRRFSDDSAVRILTIHKCKGLEFDTVFMLAIEDQMFWGDLEDERQTFFVGISRAKRRLTLTIAHHRPRPAGFRGRWSEGRTQQDEFIGYALASRA
ncbi:ATP-dependent helicase [Arthrobacter sp. StoSoilB22]|uniref:UvrD-helicase domain-containing protein n=1 Tax=Arthrobacter sp. StoSoilB22 TaxID=2830996 RepID=UPI001CC7E975|nr:ATP-dependent helicase [Arthrobacter sp. StoSoilB22]